jgi:hypothetical protein
VQVLNCSSAAGILCSGRHAVFAIQIAKHQLSGIAARSSQRPFSTIFRQPIPESPNNPEDVFRGFSILRYLQAKRSTFRNSLDEETCRYVCRNPDLTGFQHNISLAAFS